MLPWNFLKKNARNKSDVWCAQEIEFLYHDDLEVVIPRKKNARTGISPTFWKNVTRSAKKSSDGITLRKRSKTNTAELPATPDFIQKIAKEAKKLSKTYHRARKQNSCQVYTPALMADRVARQGLSLPSHRWILIT